MSLNPKHAKRITDNIPNEDVKKALKNVTESSIVSRYLPSRFLPSGFKMPSMPKFWKKGKKTTNKKTEEHWGAVLFK